MTLLRLTDAGTGLEVAVNPKAISWIQKSEDRTIIASWPMLIGVSEKYSDVLEAWQYALKMNRKNDHD